MAKRGSGRTIATETHIGKDVPDDVAFPMILRRMMARARVTTTGCWEWTGHLFRSGYGDISFRNHPTRVHRLMYRIAYGPIPQGADVLHSCDNTICFNPAHLSAGKDKRNTAESIARGRRNTARKPYGLGFPAPRDRTHCIREHALSGDNLYVTPDGRRQCRACHHEAVKRFKPKPPEAAHG
jgi:hypothetical protein